MEYGKKTVTEISGSKLIETSHSVAAGEVVLPRRIRTEESVEVHSRADQDKEYIRFADEEERLSKTGKLVEAEFQIRRTPSATARKTRYVVKKFTVLDYTS